MLLSAWEGGFGDLPTDHKAFDYGLIQRYAKLIVDARGVYKEPAENVVKA